MYRVYFNDRLLNIISIHDQIPAADLVLKLKGDETPAYLLSVINSFSENPHVESLVLQSGNIDGSWKSFTSNYQIMEAAGGVVLNHFNKVLMIFRNGKWDLPKGKIESGEDPDMAAIREVYEECGIGYLTLKKQLYTTFHTYPFHETMVLKKTYWFLMSTSDQSLPVPQVEEGITDVKWMSRLELKAVLDKTYASIRSLLKEQVLEGNSGFLG